MLVAWRRNESGREAFWQETGCVMYDAGRREIVTPEQMAGR
jgi:hypothetical protein